MDFTSRLQPRPSNRACGPQQQRAAPRYGPRSEAPEGRLWLSGASLGPAVNRAAGLSPESVAVAELNSDDGLDLGVVNGGWGLDLRWPMLVLAVLLAGGCGFLTGYRLGFVSGYQECLTRPQPDLVPTLWQIRKRAAFRQLRPHRLEAQRAERYGSRMGDLRLWRLDYSPGNTSPNSAA